MRFFFTALYADKARREQEGRDPVQASVQCGKELCK